MEFLTLIEDKKFLKILEVFQETEQKKKQVGFNLLTVSSYTNHLEHFHSDIIKTLLDPKGLHGEGNLFLDLFIDFLNKNYEIKIEKSDFQNSIVTRETGLIDIWIRDEISKKAIIIENKINNAPDPDKQLDRYFNLSSEKRYEVCCIIYLSLDGYKKAPISENQDVNQLVKNIAAYKDTKSDLYNGWLSLCLLHNLHVDTYTFVYQYAKLILHLSNMSMNTKTEEEFYEFLGKNNALQTIQTIVSLSNNLSVYRGKRFFEAVNNKIPPFKKVSPYGSFSYLMFEGFKLGENTLKLDVLFHNNETAYINFWIPSMEEQPKEQEEIIKRILSTIGMLEGFSIGLRERGMKKEFRLSDFSDSIIELDKNLLEVFQRLLAELSKLKE